VTLISLYENKIKNIDPGQPSMMRSVCTKE